MVIGFFGLFLAKTMTSWWMFLIFYAGLMPLSWGLFYSVPVILSWEWFPERKGLISGLIIGAHGFASFISSFIALAIVNPNNEVPDKLTKNFPQSVNERVSTMFNF